MHTITLKGRPADIPECIEPDISQLEVGQSILLEEIQLPKGVVAIGRSRAQVVSVTTSRMMAKAEEEDAAAKVVDEATTAEGAKNEAGADAAAG
jgi:large subunit ribosomal protein L25